MIFYQEKLITGIKFTSREVDIISCLVSGRTSKSISKMLGISFNTVNTHIRHISAKIGNSSKNEIIKFIEASDSHSYIKKRYLDLISLNEFEELIVQLYSFQHKNFGCELIYFENFSHNSLPLERHLKMIEANINFSSEDTVSNLYKYTGIKIVCCSELDIKHQISNKNTAIFFADSSMYVYCLTFLDIFFVGNNKCEIEKPLELISKFLHTLRNRYSYENQTTAIKPIDNISKKSKAHSRFTRALFLFVFVAFSLFFTHKNWHSRNSCSNLSMIDNCLLLNRSNLKNNIYNCINSQQTGNKVVVIVGPGGSGKTTLARDYAKSKKSNIVWEINAETKPNLLASVNELANELSNTNEKKRELAIINAISDKNENSKKLSLFVSKLLNHSNEWCLIFDNVDSFYTIKDWFPCSDKNRKNGTIIITTRNMNFLNGASNISQSNVIEIGSLSDEEREKLFIKILHNGSNKISDYELSKIKLFLREIPPHPLDVSTAAYYIKNTNVSFNDYLLNTKIESKEFENLQKQFLSDVTNYEKTRYGIMSFTFDNMIKHNQEFKELLLFVCLLDSKNILISYLKQYKNSVVVDEFISFLKKNSIISIENGNNESFCIHRSVQEMGLKYITSRLSKIQNKEYLNRMVISITPYESLMWTLYPKQKFRMHSKERTKIIPHLESLFSKIDNINIDLRKCKVRLLLGLAYAYEDAKSYLNIKEILDQIFDINQVNNFISREDLIALLLYDVYVCFNINKSNLLDKKLFYCLDLCNSSKNFMHQKAICMSYIGRYLFGKRMDRDALSFLRQSVECLNEINGENRASAMSFVSNQYYRSFGNNYINKDETKKAITFLLNVIKEICGVELLYKHPKKFKDVPVHLSELRLNLARAYNKVCDYEKALECELEVFFLYKKLREKGVNLVLRDAIIETEYGLTLLRTNKLYKSHDVLKKSICTISSVQNTKDLLFPLVYISEINIRLKRLDEAYSNCLSAFDFFGASQNNYTKLIENTCHYHAAIIKYKQKDCALSLKHFSEFFTRMNDFCKRFLERSVYEKLVSEKTFDITSDIKLCLKNSLKIFTAIYGENHSFVKDYIAVNCKERSWLYEKMKLAGYYFRYWIDALYSF